MAKRVLVIALSLLLLTSLSVFGQKRPENVRTDELPPMANPGDAETISKYLAPTESQIFFPATGDTAGFTYWDFQHNDIQRRQIANDHIGLKHFTWTDLIGPDWSYNIYMDYNNRDPVGGWLAPAGMRVSPTSARGGFGGLDILPDSREVLCYGEWANDWNTTLAIEKTTAGLGQFNRYDVPDWASGSVVAGTWPSMACAKVEDTAFIHITHTEGLTAGGSYRHLGYVRCFQDPNGTPGSQNLICQSPSWSAVIIPPNTKLIPNRTTYNFATILFAGSVVATSPVSQKVAIVWLQNVGSDWRCNEVKYLESTNNGNDWMASGSMGTPVQVTNYGWYCSQSAMYDIAAVYDYNDSLHIMWTTSDYYNWGNVTLWHWSPSTGIREAGSAYSSYQYPTYPGHWNTLISKMTIGVEYQPGDLCYNCLYCVYTKFNDWDRSAYGWGNGDLYVKASSSGGLTWGPEINLTNTNTNGCYPGNCQSEHWASLAERVDDSLHISYIYDLDAGGASYSWYQEGDFTLNPVRYLKYPRPLVPTIPWLAYRPWMDTKIIRWAKNGSSTNEYWDFNNTGTATLYVQLYRPSWLTTNPSSFNITKAGPTQTVNLTFNGGGFADTLLIDSLMIISNNGVPFGQEIYADTKWVKFHFVVTDNFYTYKGAYVEGGAIKVRIDNLGKLGNNNPGYGMSYNGHDYLYYSTPIIVTDILGSDDPLIAYSNFTRWQYLPQSEIQRTDSPDLRTTKIVSRFAPFNRGQAFSDLSLHCWWWWYGVETEDWFFRNSGKYDQVIVRRIKLFRNSPPPWWSDQVELFLFTPSYFGLAVDWDVPWECKNRNIGGYDSSRNLIWITSDSIGFEKYYGGVLFLGADVVDHSTGVTTHYSAPFGAHVMDYWDLMYAFPDYSYDEDSLYKYMSMSGWFVSPGALQNKNKQILITATPYLSNLSPFSAVEMKCALIITDKGRDSLYSVAAKVDTVKCGDANVDGSCSVTDVVYLINFLFKGGPAPWFFYSDANGDGKITVSDVVYLIIYLFKGGSPPLCNSMGEL